MYEWHPNLNVFTHDTITQEVLVCMAATVTGVGEDRGYMSFVTKQSRRGT